LDPDGYWIEVVRTFCFAFPAPLILFNTFAFPFLPAASGFYSREIKLAQKLFLERKK
jgi:hypothetical protein